MDPMKTAPQWGPFLSSYMGQTPAMKGMTPTETQSGRANPSSAGYDPYTTYRPTMVPNGEGGYMYESGGLSNPCPSGFRYDSVSKICVSLYAQPGELNSDGRPIPSPSTVGPSAGCPVGYQLIDGRCMYAP